MTLVLVELGLRLALGNLDIAPFVLDPGDGRCVGLEPGGESTYNGTVLRIPPVVHAVNEHGYRGPARPPARTDEVLRIVALGDSFTFGQGVAAEHALPSQLETLLQDRRGDGTVEVLNFGVPGYNLRESTEQYLYFARRWQPDLVVLFLFENDLDKPLCDIIGRRAFMAAFRRVRLFRIAVVALAPEQLGAPNPHSSPERIAALERQLAALERAVSEDGARLLVVSIADPLDDAAATRAITAELELPALVFERERFEALEVIPNETHWTAEANASAAAQIAAWLEPRL